MKGRGAVAERLPKEDETEPDPIAVAGGGVIDDAGELTLKPLRHPLVCIHQKRPGIPN